MNLISVKNLKKVFGKEEAVKGISFDIAEGGCIALLGPNGAGKTTTLTMLAGLLEPTEGSINFMGIKPGEDHRKYIGYLPQQPVFYNWMTAIEFLIYVGELAGLTKKQAKQKAEELLELLGIAEAKKKRIGGFSGGMKQRLGIAQAMIHDPKLVMLDEPVSALDPFGRREVLEMMKELKKQTTILFSTHILHDAEEVSDEIMIINKGEIVLSGALKEIRKEHQQNMITITTEENLESWVNSIKAWPIFNDISLHENNVTFFVKDVDQAREQLMKEIAEKHIPISQFLIGQSSLEDLFLKVVRS